MNHTTTTSINVVATTRLMTKHARVMNTKAQAVCDIFHIYRGRGQYEY